LAGRNSNVYLGGRLARTSLHEEAGWAAVGLADDDGQRTSSLLPS